MRNELIDDAVAMIKAVGFTPKVERNRHFKGFWFDGRGRERCLTVSVSPSKTYARQKSRALLKRMLASKEDKI